MRSLSYDPTQSILTAILLGKTKEEYGELTEEWNIYWDRVAIQVKEIQDAGLEVGYPSELD